MSLAKIIDEALHLKPQDRYIIIENLVNSLTVPNSEVDKVWIEESLKRLNAYKQGEIKTYSYAEVFR